MPKMADSAGSTNVTSAARDARRGSRGYYTGRRGSARPPGDTELAESHPADRRGDQQGRTVGQQVALQQQRVLDARRTNSSGTTVPGNGHGRPQPLASPAHTITSSGTPQTCQRRASPGRASSVRLETAVHSARPATSTHSPHVSGAGPRTAAAAGERRRRPGPPLRSLRLPGRRPASGARSRPRRSSHGVQTAGSGGEAHHAQRLAGPVLRRPRAAGLPPRPPRPAQQLPQPGERRRLAAPGISSKNSTTERGSPRTRLPCASRGK